MISARCYDDQAVAHEVPAEQISELVNHAGALILVELVDETDADLDRIAEEFQLHPLAMEDVRNQGQRPKLEHYPTHSFLVAYTADLTEIDLFIGPDWLVCHHDAGWSLKRALERFDRVRGNGPPTVGRLVHLILDEIVDAYFDRADDIEDKVEALEDRIFSEQQVADEQEVQHELFGIRREVLRFRRAVVPLREVVNAILRKEVPWITDDELISYQDVFDHVLRAIDLIDGQRELMGNAVDAHLAIISNRMNVVMKQLSAWGAIAVACTLVAGIYGMNFTHMPELHWYFGYPMALAFMAAIAMGLHRMFKKREWL